MPIEWRATLVSGVRRLYERFRLLIHEGAKFGIIGGIGVIVYNLVNGWLHFSLHRGPLTSATVAVVVTTLISYVANRYWSFRHRERTTVPRETVMFFALNGVGLLIQWAVVGFTYYGLGETGEGAKFLIVGLIGIGVTNLVFIRCTARSASARSPRSPSRRSWRRASRSSATGTGASATARARAPRAKGSRSSCSTASAC